MDYVTATEHIGQQLADARSEQDPLVRAALQLAVQAWHEGAHVGVEAVRWALFAMEVQAVEASWWTDPITHQIHTAECAAGVDLVGPVTQMIRAVAGVFARAAVDDDSEAGWRLAASATQLLKAISELEGGVSGRAQ